MYEVNLRAFSQAGDLAGVTARLDEIQSLGGNVVWLMPIHPIGQINSAGQLGSPYSVQDYRVVSSEYGTLSDLDFLVSEAHDRGMFVLMDWVANHTAWDHAWISSDPEWYTQDSEGMIIHPQGTNWLDVADLNYDSTPMRSAMISEMQYWVSNLNIDGFRADAADFVPFDFWQQAIPAVRGATQRPLLMLAEGGRTDHYQAGFDLTFGWNFYNSIKNVFNSGVDARSLVTTHNNAYAQVPAGKSILRFTTNHDESAWDAPPPVLFGSLEASLAAYAATVAIGGTPLIYNGQEIGWSQNVPFFSQSPLDWTTGQATLNWYSTLLQIREQHEPIRSGSLIDESTFEVAMIKREVAGDEVLVLVNTRDQSQQVQVPLGWQGSWVDQFSGSAEVLSSTLTLDPYEVLFLAATELTDRGDFDADGDVAGLDFLEWQRGGSPMPLSKWDLTVWETSYMGTSALASSAATVPEPTTLAVGLVILISSLSLRRRQSSEDSATDFSAS